MTQPAPKHTLRKAALAWPQGDVPGELAFRHPVPAPLAKAVIKAAGDALGLPLDSGVELGRLSPGDGAAGGYRLAVGQEAWFVRVTARKGEPELEMELARHLEKEGAPVNRTIACGIELAWQGENYRLDIRELLQGGHYQAKPGQPEAVARALAKVHQALVSFPQAARVRDRAVRRYKALADINLRLGRALEDDDLSLFGPMQPWARKNLAWLRTMADNFRPIYHLEPAAGCLHGEPHPANIIFTGQGQEAVLVDFEEAVHTFAPPQWDLAYFFQRLCLRDGPSPGEAEGRAAALATAYGRELGDLAGWMRQTSWLAMATILDMLCNQNLLAPASEFDKFIGLERQARDLAGVV